VLVVHPDLVLVRPEVADDVDEALLALARVRQQSVAKEREADELGDDALLRGPAVEGRPEGVRIGVTHAERAAVAVGADDVRALGAEGQLAQEERVDDAVRERAASAGRLVLVEADVLGMRVHLALRPRLPGREPALVVRGDDREAQPPRTSS
jgi:hypothetical protein